MKIRLAKKPPAVAALLITFQELATLLWLQSVGCLAQLSKQCSLMKAEAVGPK